LSPQWDSGLVSWLAPRRLLGLGWSALDSGDIGGWRLAQRSMLKSMLGFCYLLKAASLNPGNLELVPIICKYLTKLLQYGKLFLGW
jgi:hypothetical protein